MIEKEEGLLHSRLFYLRGRDRNSLEIVAADRICLICTEEQIPVEMLESKKPLYTTVTAALTGARSYGLMLRRKSQ